MTFCSICVSQFPTRGSEFGIELETTEQPMKAEQKLTVAAFGYSILIVALMLGLAEMFSDYRRTD